MTKQVYEDLKELEAAYKKLTCSIQQAFISTELKTELKSELTELKPVMHAKWEKFCDRNGILHYLECSNCGQVSNQILLTYKYCPHCGARMDKE